MAFVNTRDTIGDQATVDGLVEHSLTELKEDGITILSNYALYENNGLRTIVFPNIQKIGKNALTNCISLEVLDIGNEQSNNEICLDSNACQGCLNLKHLILRNSQVSSLGNNVFNNNPLSKRDGIVYVPNSLLSTYKSSIGFRDMILRTIDQYPLTSLESIADDWSTILSNPEYASLYSISDIKTMTLSDGSKIDMDLVAFDTDDKSDGSGKAKMTWIAHTINYSACLDDSGNDGDWATSSLRTFLINNILSKIPVNIKDHIVSVNKIYRLKNELKTSNDEIWVPSAYELTVPASQYYGDYENDGSRYNTMYRSEIKRTCATKISGDIRGYWIRTWPSHSYIPGIISTSGSLSAMTASDNRVGIVFGFCTD